MLDDAALATARYEIETLGFTVVRNVISTAQTTALRAALLEALEQDKAMHAHLPGKNPQLVDNLVLHGGAFLALLGNDAMHQVFGLFLTQHCILYNYSSTVLLPQIESKVQQTHVDSPRIIPGYHEGLIMTLALDDFTDENGATRYLPGSYSLMQPPSEETFSRYAQSVARPAGAAVFFNPRTFHRGEANTGEAIRCGVTIFAVRPYMKQRFDYPAMLGEAPGDARIAKFLGFDARPPASMDRFYAPVEQRSYKPNQE